MNAVGGDDPCNVGTMSLLVRHILGSPLLGEIHPHEHATFEIDVRGPKPASENGHRKAGAADLEIFPNSGKPDESFGLGDPGVNLGLAELRRGALSACPRTSAVPSPTSSEASPPQA
jgi:hypothetical protein